MGSLWRLRSRRITGLDRTSFSVVFVIITATLLIIFMMQPTPSPGVGIDLPKTHFPTAMPAANSQRALKLAIARDGTMFLGNAKVRPDGLPSRIQEHIRQGAERKVYIKADARVRYRAIKDAIDAIHDGGVEKVVFLADKYGAP